ncbi:MAG: aldo/keto reductase [Acidobacteriia bacterium]|nr:aldo/keto reductase [Terriglobia bacterium]
MNHRFLGRTGLLVSELCFGAMTFGGKGMWANAGSQTQGEADNLVARVLDAGVNFFDTANVYSEGESEKILGKALGARRKGVVLATKVAGRVGPGPNDIGLSRRQILEAIDASLARLGTDYVDLYQIHSFDRLTPLEETLGALDAVVRSGKVRYIGCSNLAAWQIMKAIAISESRGWARFDSLQAYYSIAGRDLERELVPLLVDQNVGLMVWSPLAGGFLSDKYAGGKGPAEARRAKFDFPPLDKERALKCIAAMREVADAHDATVARVALAWLLDQKVVSSVIIGAKTQEQLEDNLKAVDIKLSAEERKRLDEVSALPPEYPGWALRMAAGWR